MGDRSGLTKLDRTNGFDDGRDYMRVKKSKLAQQNEEIREALQKRNNPLRTDLFKGISINVNGRTQPTADELKRLILLNGGDYHPYYRYQSTKFMIATNLSSARIKTLRPDDRIVRPEWITDSIKAKCILPYQDYQLFEESNTVQLQLTDGNSTSNDDGPLRITSGATKGRPSNASNRLSNGKLNNNVVDKKHQITLDNFVIRNATRPKTDDVKFDKPSTSKPTNKNNTIRDCFKNEVKGSNSNKLLANICGLTNIDAIVGLLNEWVGCPEGVRDEDTACVTKYFYDLMNEKDFHDKFYEIIYSFQQRVIEHDERCWLELYNNMAETLKAELTRGSEASQNLCHLIPMIEINTSKTASQSSPITTIVTESPEVIINTSNNNDCIDTEREVINIDDDDDDD